MISADHMGARRIPLRCLLAAALFFIVGGCAQFYLQHIKPLEIIGFKTVLVDDTVWDQSGSPYHITDNIFILPEATLTIAPGTDVCLGPDVQIKSQGRIVAVGTAEAPIRIHGTQKGPWDRIDCFGGRFEKNGALPLNRFEHCVVEDGRGIIIRAAAVHVENCELRNNISTPIRVEYGTGVIRANHIHGNTTVQEPAAGNGAGIMVYTDKAVTIADNQVHDNVSSGGRDGGGGIYAFAYDSGRIAIRGNRVENNTSDRHGGGIVAYASTLENNWVNANQTTENGGGIYAIASRVLTNRVGRNTAARGGGIYADNCRLENNQVIDNQANPSGGGGLFYFGDTCITRNTFTGNSGDTIVVSGNPAITENNIIAPAGYALRVQTHSLAADLNARNNYWGTDRAEVIKSLIYDWLTDAAVGLADTSRPADQWITTAPEPPAGSPATVSRAPQPLLPGHIAGRLTADTVFGDGSCRLYHIDGNLLIAENVTATVKPGTTFSIARDCIVRVRGRLWSAGVPGAPVQWTGDPDRPWGGLLFENKNSAVDAATTAALSEDMPANRKGLLRHCIIEHGQGIVMEGTGPRIEKCRIQHHHASGVTIRNAAVTLLNNTIIGNRSPTNGGGIYAYGSRFVEITGNRIEANSAVEDGGGVFAYGYRSNTAVNLTGNVILKNTCGGAGGGVWASRSGIIANRVMNNQAYGQGGGIFATFALVEKNEIDTNEAGQGGGVFAETNSTLTENRIRGNTATQMQGGGAYLNYWGVSIKNETFSHNLVSGNRAMVSGGAGGIYLNGELTFNRNSIFENSGYQLYNGNSADHPALDALDCYWGSARTEDIFKAIFDGSDDPRFAIVNFKPFAKSMDIN